MRRATRTACEPTTGRREGGRGSPSPVGRKIPVVTARVLHLTSNGWGMGHLSRQAAIALAGRGRITSTVMSMSGAVPVVQGLGVPTEFCPGNDRGWVDSREWHAYLRDRIVALAEETEATTLVFDGVAPYPGIGRARPMLPGVRFVWMRRGMWIPGANDHALGRVEYFDEVLEPGDLAESDDRGPTVGRSDAVRISPVSMLSVEPMIGRSEAARVLGIDPTRPTLLVTLGTGRLGDVAGPGRVVLETALGDPRWQICLTKPAIAGDGMANPDPDRVIELADVYPLTRYLAAFDAAVSAAGYNAVHEFLPASIPTLFVPSPKSVTDDQRARARWSAAHGLALVAEADDLEEVGRAASCLLDDAVRTDLRQACQAIGVPEGADQAVGVLVDGSARLRATHRRPGPDDPGLGPRVRWEARRLIGPAATSVVRWALRRHGERPDVDRKALSVTDHGDQDASRLVFGTDLTLELLRSGAVVEHLVPGSSNRYRAVRRSIIGRFYEMDARWVALER